MRIMDENYLFNEQYDFLSIF